MSFLNPTPFIRHLFSLYALQVANYVLPFLLIPYLFQMLGAEKYGLLAFANSLAWYFVILCNYSFDLTTTRDIAVNRDNIQVVSRLFSSVLLTKLVLYFGGLLITILMVSVVPQLRRDWEVYGLAYAMVAGFVVMPVWFYQGLEKMGLVSLLVFLSRLFYFSTVIFFVHNEEDYVLALGLQSAGVLMYGLIGLLLVRSTMAISWIWPSVWDIFRTLRENWSVFISHVSTLLFSNSQVVIVGFFYSHDQVAYFSVADKVIRAFAIFAMPLHQALFPRTSALVKESFSRGLTYVKDIVRWVGPVYLMVSLGVFFCSDYLIEVFVGQPADLPASLLRIMSLLPFLTLIELLLAQLLLSLNLNQLYMRLTLIAVAIGLFTSFALVSVIGSQGAAWAVMIFESVLVACLAAGLVKSRLDAIG